MHQHSCAFDSLSRSQSLSSHILSSSSPAQISAACAAVDSFLHSHSPDHSRHFFSIAFPSLICKLFGFDDAASSSPNHGWIDAVLESNDPDLASRVFGLLSPSGALMNSIFAVDRLGLVKFAFPIERLPEWTRFMLLNDKDCRVLADLCPIFKGKIKEDAAKGSLSQVQLNVFEYFVFWFAYYPVCRGNSENKDRVTAKKSRRSRLESWASSIPVISSVKRGPENNKVECNLYIRLLYAYLRAFVPVYDLKAHQPYRSSLLHYQTEYDGSMLVQAEFLVNALIHYWLVDNDFSPLSVHVCKSFGMSFPFRTLFGEIPPTSGLGEVVKLFVKYLNLSAVSSKDAYEFVDSTRSPQRGFADSPDLMKRDVMSGTQVHRVGAWNAWIQRPLYRYILRAFLFSPVETSSKNASQVFSVWISYVEPWNISSDDFAELDAAVGGLPRGEKTEDAKLQGHGYSSFWQDYVLSNYLYYSSLVVHFIGFAHKFLHMDAEAIVQMVLKILSILTSSKELMDLIKNVDTHFHTKDSGIGKSSASSLYRYIPSIREQLQDWEDGLSESDADGSFLHENWNKDLRLFSDGEDGGRHLLQLFMLRAESELQALSGSNLQLIGSLKEEVSKLFGGGDFLWPSCPKPDLKTREELFKPRKMGGNNSPTNIKYKGDWMKRPASDDEIAWLARLLVQLSGWLNEALGLNHTETSPKCAFVKVPADVANEVCGPAETVKTILYAVLSWLFVVGGAFVGVMRRHGLRVNLRILASKKIVSVLFVSAVFALLRRGFRQIYNG